MYEGHNSLAGLHAAVTAGLAALKPHLRSWAQDHLIEPREVRLAIDPEGTAYKMFWLITDHVGKNDASYRVVYDTDAQEFGLECTLESGVEWYMGIYGSFVSRLKTCEFRTLRALRTLGVEVGEEQTKGRPEWRPLSLLEDLAPHPRHSSQLFLAYHPSLR